LAPEGASVPLLAQLRRSCIACLNEDPPLAERATSIAHNALQISTRARDADPRLDELALALACVMMGQRERWKHHALRAARIPFAAAVRAARPASAPAVPAAREETPQTLELLVALTRVHTLDGDGDAIEACASRACALARELHGDESLELADICTALLPACADYRPELAVELARDALVLRVQALGPCHEATAAAHRNLGLALLSANAGADAIGEYEEALLIERALRGDEQHSAVREGVELLALARRHASQAQSQHAAKR
jgi:hypothetical protein